MKKRYIFLALILLGSAGGLLFLDNLPDATRLAPEQLLLKARMPGHYISSDVLADKIISGDPSLLLVDLRDSVAYAQYSLPNALNIPYQKLLNKDNIGYFDQDQFDVVLYSNDHLISDQSWLLLTSKNFNNLYVLENGLNGFFSTILHPKEPSPGAPNKDFELYSLRKASSYFFGVPMPNAVHNASGIAGVSETGGTLKTKKRKAIVIRKKKKKKIGGC